MSDGDSRARRSDGARDGVVIVVSYCDEQRSDASQTIESGAPLFGKRDERRSDSSSLPLTSLFSTRLCWTIRQFTSCSRHYYIVIVTERTNAPRCARPRCWRPLGCCSPPPRQAHSLFSRTPCPPSPTRANCPSSLKRIQLVLLSWALDRVGSTGRMGGRQGWLLLVEERLVGR